MNEIAPLRIIDRDSAIDAIEKLQEEDLRFLNQLIIQRLKHIHQARQTRLLGKFYKGDRVKFRSPDSNEELSGVVIRVNKKSLSIDIGDGRGWWNVSPSFVSLI